MPSSADKPAVRGPRGGVLLVIAATVVSAASGLITLMIVAPAVGPAGYASFSVYWAALFMIVGVLFGLQQETTRAVADVGARAARGQELHGGSSVLRFAAVLAATVLVLIAATSFLWAPSLFGAGGAAWGIALSVGAASYAGVATLNGILAGSGRWGGFATVLVIDGLLRLALVAAALMLGADGTVLAWAVALPFPVSFLAVALLQRKVVRAHASVRESYRALAHNSSRTVVASASNAVLVTGFPLILSLVASDDRAALGAVVLALTLARAPILVPLTALQSMLIARFSASPATARRLMTLVMVGLVAVAATLGTIVGLWGESVLVWWFGAGFAVPGALLTWLVIASGCLGLLTVTGAHTLAAGRHTLFAAGWAIACLLAIATVAFTPADVGTRTVIGLIAGPLAGVVVHLVVGRRR